MAEAEHAGDTLSTGIGAPEPAYGIEGSACSLPNEDVLARTEEAQAPPEGVAQDNEFAASSRGSLLELGCVMSEAESALIQRATVHESMNELDAAALLYEQVLNQNPYNVRHRISCVAT